MNLESFIKHVSEEHLIAEGQRVLLAVSGGRDSVTLLDLMSRAGYDVGVAHCNFHLRPGDCDRDEAFVRKLAKERSVECYVAQFDTEKYAKEHGYSIEEAARELRYGFFEKVRALEGYDLIATAHHRDDAVETFFINLLRGTGIGGLHGIKARNGYIVRPLLAFGRDEIDSYVAEQGLPYVEDYTNSEVLYLRNKIRLQLLPMLREMAPSFDSIMESNMQHLADADSVYRRWMEEQRMRIMPEADKIDIKELRRYEPVETILFELLRPYNFNGTVVSQIASSLDSQSGKQFFSPSHRLVKDRGKLIITKREAVRRSKKEKEYLIGEDCNTHGLPVLMHMHVQPNSGEMRRLNRNEAWFDREGLHFPLVLRQWRDGDRFRPFGMRGTRLVSDLLSDQKVSIDKKERVWLLCDGDEEGTILWVVGLRAANRAVVSESTKDIVKFRVVIIK